MVATETPYFYFVTGIQQYLFENNRIDNIFTDFFYERFTDCLNEILSSYEVSLNAQGIVLICFLQFDAGEFS
jgi:zinc finger MYM-type protein 2/3/4